MKKFIIFALATVLCFALCACGDEQEVVTSVVETTTEAVDTAAETTPVTELATTESASTEGATTEVVTTEVTTTEATTVAVTEPAVVSISPDEFYAAFKGCWTNSNNEFWHFRESGGKPVMYLSVWDTDVFSGNGEIKKVSQTAPDTYTVSVHFPDYVDPRDESGTVLIPAYDKDFAIIKLSSDSISVDGTTYKFGRQLG